jgi:NADH:ubiquinone oxidoreductase subunit E
MSKKIEKLKERLAAQKHIFVCGGKSCRKRQGRVLRKALKRELKTRNEKKIARVIQCSCLGLCSDGANVVVHPGGTCMVNLTLGDVPRLVDFLEGKGPPPGI